MKIIQIAVAVAVVAFIVVQKLPNNDTHVQDGVISASIRTPDSKNRNLNFNFKDMASVSECVKKVVVVGGGAAGLAASVEAIAAGARSGVAVCVSLIDKQPSIGGNSAKASSGINAAGTRHQQKEGIDDTIDLFAQDTLKSGGGESTPELVQVLAADSSDAISFLESFGLDMSLISQCGGHSRKRTHRPFFDATKKPTNTGMAIIAALNSQLDVAKEKGRFQLLTNTRVLSLLTKPNPLASSSSTAAQNSVVGVKVEISSGESKTTDQIVADAVILATGGFSASPELLARFAPRLAHLPTTNGPFATGDGLSLGEEVGAALTQIENIQVHPTGFIDPQDPQAYVKWLAPEALRASGGILLGADGKRFVNELGYRDQVTKAIFEHGTKTKKADGSEGNIVATLVMTEEATKQFPLPPIYKIKGFIKSAQNLDELAAALSLPPPVLQATLEEYEEGRKAGKDAFGKTVFPCPFPPSSSPLSYMTITPSLHYTMGGLLIDPAARVISTGGGAVPGLYACGEVTGGVHGHNRLAGNGLLDNLVFGRRAAETAVAELLQQQK